jgi:hypothetical protein
MKGSKFLNQSMVKTHELYMISVLHSGVAIGKSYMGMAEWLK